MEREVAESVNIAVAMVAIAALLGIIAFTVFLGNEVKTGSVENAIEIADSVASSYFNDIAGKDTVLPSAAAYAILNKYRNVLASSECKIPSGAEYNTAEECLSRHLTGKVSLQVIKISEGQFRVIVHSIDCPWYTGTCNE